jgi:hypothetical protein
MIMSDKTIIVELLSRYMPFGKVMGGELCLPPDKALVLLKELEVMGIGIMGFDGWCYIDKENKVIAQDFDVDVSIEGSIFASTDLVSSSIAIARDYILTKLPERINFVSLTLDIPYLWKDLFPND